MKLYVFALLAVFLIHGFSSQAYAQLGKVVQCGIPKDVSVERDPAYNFCDIYTRQLAYREKRQGFRADIEARRANFSAPGAAARKIYLDSVKEYNYGSDESGEDVIAVSAEKTKASDVGPKGSDIDDLNNQQLAKLMQAYSE